MISISSAVCFLPLELGHWEARWLGSSRVRVWYVCQWGEEHDDYDGVCSGFVLRDFRVPTATGVHEKACGCASSGPNEMQDGEE